MPMSPQGPLHCSWRFNILNVISRMWIMFTEGGKSGNLLEAFGSLGEKRHLSCHVCLEQRLYLVVG